MSRAMPTWLVHWARPRWANLGMRSRAERARPSGAYTSRSRAWSTGVRSSVTASHAVPAELLVDVGELARVLDEEAALADELARRPGADLGRLPAAVLGVHRLVLVFLLLVGHDDEAVLEDGFE